MAHNQRVKQQGGTALDTADQKKPRGRPRAFDRQEALDSAMRVFWSTGFLGTSNNDLCQAMGINSPSLYAAFGSKENLYIEAVGRYNELSHASIWHHLDDAPTAREGIQKSLLAAADAMPANMLLPSGCMVTLATVGSECPSAVADAVKDSRLAGIGRFREAIERGVTAGELPKATDVSALARFFSGVVQGMAIQARDGATTADLIPLAEVAMDVWPKR